ncbi:MAG: tetratricopeptide repeat protein [bacterium]|nr:tetratricopeptide repeat protein [bacterium]
MSRRAPLTAALFLAAAAWPLAAGAVVPMSALPAGAVPDSAHVEPGGAELDPIPQGAATGYMVGSTLLAEGDLAGALPFLAQAYRMSPDELTFARTYRDALQQVGYLRDATDVARRIVHEHPESFEGWERLIALSAAQERYADAREALEGCRRAHPDSTRLDLVEAELLVRTHAWAEAMAAYRQALPRHPEHRERIYGSMAELASLLNRPEEAAALWTEGLAVAPGSRSLRLGRIQHLIDNERDGDAMAVAVAGDSLVVARGDAPAWVELTSGMIAQAGREAAAMSLLLPMWEAGALDLGAALQLSRLHARAGDWERAIALAGQIAQRWPEAARPHLFLGEFLAGRGDLAAGEAETRRALALDPGDPDNVLALISILSRRHPDLFTGRAADGDATAPVREVHELADRAAALLDENSPLGVRMMLGATYQGLGDHEASIPYYERAAEDPELRRNALLNLSLACEQTGRPDEALAALESLLTDHPDDHVIQNALGYTLADHDRDLPRAESLIRAALKSEPENPAYLDSLGWLLHRQGLPLEAFDLLVRATNALPEDPVILEHLGMVLLDLGRHDRAYDVFLRARAAGGDSASLEAVLKELQPAAANGGER